MLEEDPFTRMKMVVRWYLSGFYKKPKVSIICHAVVYIADVFCSCITFTVPEACVQCIFLLFFIGSEEAI